MARAPEIGQSAHSALATRMDTTPEVSIHVQLSSGGAQLPSRRDLRCSAQEEVADQQETDQGETRCRLHHQQESGHRAQCRDDEAGVALARLPRLPSPQSDQGGVCEQDEADHHHHGGPGCDRRQRGEHPEDYQRPSDAMCPLGHGAEHRRSAAHGVILPHIPTAEGPVSQGRKPPGDRPGDALSSRRSAMTMHVGLAGRRRSGRRPPVPVDWTYASGLAATQPMKIW